MMSSNQQINNKRHSKKSMFSSEESPKKQRIEDEKEKAVGHVVASASVTVETTSSIMAKIEMVPQPLENGLYLSKVECLGSQANSRALSLFELIRAIRPIASIHFNFCIDPGWVLRQYSRSLRNCPISFIVGQRHLPALKAECSKWSNVQCASVPLPFAYGTHHTKLSLFESETALHVVVSTSNLLEEDWALKTQAFYHWRAPFPPDATETEEETLHPQKGRMQQPENFRDDLVEYLQKGYPKSAGSASQLVSYWLDRIMGGKADFSKCPDRLVGSVPGRYFKSIGEFSKFGHLKLRALLARKFSTEELQANKTFIGQFSSLGSLGAKPESWLCTEFLDSLSGGAKSQSLPNSCLKLVYPTVENVRQSLEGYAAGLSLPYTSEVHKRQPYLRQFLHQWKSERHGRSLAMPHVKSYTALDDQGQPQWLLVTSANLSGSAWGKLEKEGNQLFLRSFELGVLLCAKDHPEGLLLSFDLPLTKYSPEDQQFLVDLRYAQMPDTNGFRGARDVRQLTSNSIQRIHLSNSSNTSNQII